MIYTIGHISPDLDATATPFAYAEYLNASQAYGQAVTPLLSGEPNTETKKLFSKFQLPLPKLAETIQASSEDKFVLVDHNEASQRHQVVNNDQIIEVLDHHKANINFSTPIKINFSPLGSSCSIVYLEFEKAGLTPSKNTAGVMLAAILDDTQGLKSSTCTQKDKDIAQKLSEISGQNISELILEIFKAKSDLTNLTPLQIVKKDYKVFDFGTKVYITVVETAEPQALIQQRDNLLQALDEAKVSENADRAFLFVVDLINGTSQAVYKDSQDEEVISKAFGVQGEKGVASIGPRTSRKKDIAPEIERVFKQA